MLRVFALPLIVMLSLMIAPASGLEDWEKVESKEGGFTVEFPGKPTINKSRSRKAGGGEVKTVIIGHEGEAGLYIAYKIKLPTSIVKGTENAELDAERDGMAKEWNGKVTAERKIRAGKTVGRDFTIRGTPEKGAGTLTIRMREYLADDSVYIVAVISLPNRELPADTGRFLGSLAIGGTRAAGTPTPEQKGTELAGWGLALDPLKDCEFLVDKNRLRMKVTGSGHQKPAEHPMLNAPRVMREVEGDFVVTVKVAGEFKPGGKSTNPKSLPFNGAGILVFSDADNYIRLERAAVNRNGRINTYVNFEEFEGGSHGVTHNEVMKGGDCWVRMERKGSRIHGSISFDGTTWKELKPIQTVWPAKLKIGLCANSSSGLPFEVAFEEYELKAKPRKAD
jgi:regulation of enolase protein 1 (concanavalin A-like superfamily)